MRGQLALLKFNSMFRGRNMHISSQFTLSQSTPIEGDAQGQSSLSDSQLFMSGKGKEKSRSYIVWNREMDTLFA